MDVFGIIISDLLQRCGCTTMGAGDIRGHRVDLCTRLLPQTLGVSGPR
jgi:hypothetical protein